MSESKPPVETQAIQKANPAGAVALTGAGVALQTLDDLLKFAKMCTDNGAAPKGMNHQQAAIAIQIGLERGLKIMSALQSSVVINGVLSFRGWAAVGLIQNSPVVVPGTWRSWVENRGTDQAVGYCRAQRKGYAEPFLRSFSVNDAKKAGLWKKDGPWQARPDNMLEWRAIGDMGRFHFGDVLGGIPIAEDVEAGGIGPTEGVVELPAESRPAPPTRVRDPILAELVEATLVKTPKCDGNHGGPPCADRECWAIEDEAAGRTPEPEEVDHGPSEFGRLVRERIAAEREKTPEVQAAIDAQVDEDLSPRPRAGDPSAQPGDSCSRCKATLNQMGGCDVCGWPGPDTGERL